VIALRWYCYLLLFVLVLMGIGGCASSYELAEHGKDRCAMVQSKHEGEVKWGLSFLSWRSETASVCEE
jgi:glycine/D-amino acid oxidase-like deaminating enzyme